MANNLVFNNVASQLLVLANGVDPNTQQTHPIQVDADGIIQLGTVTIDGSVTVANTVTAVIDGDVTVTGTVDVGNVVSVTGTVDVGPVTGTVAVAA
ncbi:hypothetical protein, partial [Clostridium senegalense]|uniref:hypothetical protein n=1 Tax=Clostridium senegalense TaxID=1465809 RepID=UPI0002893480